MLIKPTVTTSPSKISFCNPGAFLSLTSQPERYGPFSNSQFIPSSTPDSAMPPASSSSKSPKKESKKVAEPASPETVKPKQKAAKPAATSGPNAGKHPKVYRATKALKLHTEKLLNQPSAKQQLFSKNHPIAVEILLHKVPIKGSMKRKVIPLKFPIWDKETTEICIFVGNKEKAKKTLELASAPNIKKIIEMKKLRTHYTQYEARRKLAASYDLFLVEDNILPDVCKLLGSSFLRSKKAPISVRVSSACADRIAHIRDSTTFELAAGVNQSYKIGLSSMTEEQVCQNFLESIDSVVENLPLKWANVKQIALTTFGSIPLPVYSNVTVPAIKRDGNDTDVSKDETEQKNGKAANPTKPQKNESESNGNTPTKSTPTTNSATTPKKTEASTPESAAKKNSPKKSKPISAPAVTPTNKRSAPSTTENTPSKKSKTAEDTTPHSPPAAKSKTPEAKKPTSVPSAKSSSSASKIPHKKK